MIKISVRLVRRMAALSGAYPFTALACPNMSVDDKKKSDVFTENVVAESNDADDFRLLTAETRKAGERALVRKLDCWLMPTAVVIYLLNYIDV